MTKSENHNEMFVITKKIVIKTSISKFLSYSFGKNVIKFWKIKITFVYKNAWSFREGLENVEYCI